MKKVRRLSEDDLTKIVKQLINENVVNSIAEKHIESFTNKTINDFSDTISKMEEELNKNGLFITNNGSIVGEFMDDIIKISQKLINRVVNLQQNYEQLNKK